LDVPAAVLDNGAVGELLAAVLLLLL